MMSLYLNGDISYLCIYPEKAGFKEIPDDLLHDYNAVKTALLNSLEDTPCKEQLKKATTNYQLANPQE